MSKSKTIQKYLSFFFLFILIFSALLMKNDKKTEALDVGISINGTYATEAFVGEKIKIANITLSDNLIYDNLIVKIENSHGEMVDELSGDVFTPSTNDIYKIIYLFNYKNKEIVYYYFVNVSFSDSPIIIEEPCFPYAFIDNVSQEISSICAFYFSEFNQPVKADVKIEYEYNNENNIISDNKFTPLVERNGDLIKVNYTIGNRDRDILYKSYDVPVVKIKNENGSLMLSNTFYQINIDNCITDKSFSTYFTSNDGACLEYANVIPANSFQFRWKMNNDLVNFDYIMLVLTDYQNKEEELKLKIYQNNGQKDYSYISVNGTVYTTKNSFKDGSFNIRYFNSNQNVLDENGIIAKVDDPNFNGFSSGLIKFRVEFGGVHGYSSISVSHVCNQTMNNVVKDSISPYIFFKDEMVVRYEKGDLIKINMAQAYDMLDPSPKVKVILYKLDNNGEVDETGVESEDNISINNISAEKDYYILANSICNYRVEYTVIDWNNRKLNRTFIITVDDNEKPTFNLNGEVASKVKQNEIIILPSYTVSDNLGTEKITVQISYLTPNGVLEVLTNGSNQIKVTEKGRYIIYYFVYDEYYNYVLNEYNIIVT